MRCRFRIRVKSGRPDPQHWFKHLSCESQSFNPLFFYSHRVEDIDNQGNTALHAAAYTGHISLLKVIALEKFVFVISFLEGRR
jgi:hypothetical protein